MNFRGLLRVASQWLGIEIRRCSASTVYEDPYEALFEQDPRVVFKFPTRFCVDKLGFSYGLWQPWVETVGQLRFSDSLAYRDSVLKAFYNAWEFPLLESVFGEKIPRGKIRNHLLKVFHGPFLPFSRRLAREPVHALQANTRYLESDNRSMGHFLSIDESLNEDGTWTDAKGDVELKRLRRLLKSIGKSGYLRNDGCDGDIMGYLLRRDGSLRFVIVWGLHRASVLSALGEGKLTVRLSRDIIIDCDSVASWPLVKEGLWTQQRARQYFDHLFDFDWENWTRAHGFGRSQARADLFTQDKVGALAVNSEDAQNALPSPLDSRPPQSKLDM